MVFHKSLSALSQIDFCLHVWAKKEEKMHWWIKEKERKFRKISKSFHLESRKICVLLIFHSMYVKKKLSSEDEMLIWMLAYFWNFSDNGLINESFYLYQTLSHILGSWHMYLLEYWLLFFFFETEIKLQLVYSLEQSERILFIYYRLIQPLTGVYDHNRQSHLQVHSSCVVNTMALNVQKMQL